MNKIEYDKLRAERMLKFFLSESPPKNCKIFDVGCGGGELLMLLENEGFECYGLDIDGEALKKAQDKSNAQFVRGDVYKLPFKNSSFDVIFCMDLFEHLFDPHAAINEIKRVLKDGGYIYFNFPLELNLEHRIKILFGKNIHNPLAVGSHIRFFKPKDVKNLLELNGMKILKYRYYCPGYKLAKYLPALEKLISNTLPALFAGNMLVKATKVKNKAFLKL